MYLCFNPSGRNCALRSSCLCMQGSRSVAPLAEGHRVSLWYVSARMKLHNSKKDTQQGCELVGGNLRYDYQEERNASILGVHNILASKLGVYSSLCCEKNATTSDRIRNQIVMKSAGWFSPLSASIWLMVVENLSSTFTDFRSPLS